MTADAIVCQKDVARELRSGRNDYVFALKDDHPLVNGEVTRLLTPRARRGAGWRR